MEIFQVISGGADLATIGICFYLYGLKKDVDHLRANFKDFKQEVRDNG